MRNLGGHLLMLGLLSTTVLLATHFSVAFDGHLDHVEQAAETHYQVAMRALANGDLSVARSELERAAELVPNNALIWYNLAVVSSKLGAVFVAKEALERAQRLGLPPAQRQPAAAILADMNYALLKRRSSPRIILAPILHLNGAPGYASALQTKSAELFALLLDAFRRAGAEPSLARDTNLASMPAVQGTFRCKEALAQCYIDNAAMARDLAREGYDAYVDFRIEVNWTWLPQQWNEPFPDIDRNWLEIMPTVFRVPAQRIKGPTRSDMIGRRFAETERLGRNPQLMYRRITADLETYCREVIDYMATAASARESAVSQARRQSLTGDWSGLQYAVSVKVLPDVVVATVSEHSRDSHVGYGVGLAKSATRIHDVDLTWDGREFAGDESNGVMEAVIESGQTRRVNVAASRTWRFSATPDGTLVARHKLAGPLGDPLSWIEQRLVRASPQSVAPQTDRELPSQTSTQRSGAQIAIAPPTGECEDLRQRLPKLEGQWMLDRDTSLAFRDTLELRLEGGDIVGVQKMSLTDTATRATEQREVNVRVVVDCTAGRSRYTVEWVGRPGCTTGKCTEFGEFVVQRYGGRPSFYWRSDVLSYAGYNEDKPVRRLP